MGVVVGDDFWLNLEMESSLMPTIAGLDRCNGGLECGRFEEDATHERT